MVYAASFLAIASMAAQMSHAQRAIVKAPVAQQSAARVGASAPLDYEVFRTKVQPILTGPRRGNARCTSCHSRGGGNSFLEPLPAGATAYTEEQSRRNFERVSRLVSLGQPTRSILLTNPLLEEAGGSHCCTRGRHSSQARCSAVGRGGSQRCQGGRICRCRLQCAPHTSKGESICCALGG